MSEDFKIQTDYSLIIAAEAPPPVDILTPHTEWIPAAKTGQVVKLKDGLGVITEEGLKSSVGTWKNGFIFKDHKRTETGFNIHGDKFVAPYLYFLLDENIVAELGKSAGGSIDATATKIDGNRVTGIAGIGYSILSLGRTPSCTKEAGCGIPIAGEVELADIETKWDFNAADYTPAQLEEGCAWKDTSKQQDERTVEDYKLVYRQPDGKIVWSGLHTAMSVLNSTEKDVNIPQKDRETVYNILSAGYKLFDKEPPKLKQDIKAELKNEGGHEREMVDKKEEVTYSEEQVTAIRAAAVAEATETLDNAHKVAVGEMESAKTAELKTLREVHIAELAKQHDATYKQAVMVESLSTQYSLTPEAKKALTDAKTLEDALALFAGLDITKPIAAEGAADNKDGKGTGSKGGGVIQGAGEDLKGQAPKTVKVEEVGSYDAVTGKYIPTFREELI